MRELGEKVDRGTGDRRPAEQLPGYDGPDAMWPWKRPTRRERIRLALDWRDPRNMQVYPDPLLELDTLLNLQAYATLDVQDLVDRLRVVTRHDAAAAFALMMGLSDDRLINEDVSICDPVEPPVARAYQAALKVFHAYHYEQRLKVGSTYLAAARIIAQLLETELLLHDLVQKRRELSARKARQLSPWTFETVLDVLACWRGLRIGDEPSEGSRLNAVAKHYNRDRSTLRESVDNAISGLQDRFCRYCNGLVIPVPPENHIRA